GAFALEDGHEHAAPAIAVDDVGLHQVAHVDVAHVFHVHGHAVDRLDGNLVDCLNQIRAAVELDVVFRLADLRGAGGKDQALGIDGGLDVLRRQAAGVQLTGVEIDHHLRPLTAPRL